MAITNYTELQSAINNWGERNDSASQLQEFIAVAESRLNRELGSLEASQDIIGTIGSREIDISAYPVDGVTTLYFVDSDGDETEVTPVAFPNLKRVGASGQPTKWALREMDTLVFDRQCNAAYSFRMAYDQKIRLSDAAPTNWLLTNHSDIYLAACMMWSGAFNEHLPGVANWKALLDEDLMAVKRELNKAKRTTLSTDPALRRSRRVP